MERIDNKTIPSIDETGRTVARLSIDLDILELEAPFSVTAEDRVSGELVSLPIRCLPAEAVDKIARKFRADLFRMARAAEPLEPRHRVTGSSDPRPDGETRQTAGGGGR